MPGKKQNCNINKTNTLNMKARKIRQKHKGKIPSTMDAKKARQIHLAEKLKKKLEIKKQLRASKQEAKMLLD